MRGLWAIVVFLFLALIALAFIPFPGDTVSKEVLLDEKIEHVTRVLVHTIAGDGKSGEFTLWTQEPESRELKPIKVFGHTFRVIADVADTKPMWAIKGKLEKTKHNNPEYDYVTIGYLEIHIRSEKDLEGGAWKYSYQSNKQLMTVEGYTHVLCCDSPGKN